MNAQHPPQFPGFNPDGGRAGSGYHPGLLSVKLRHPARRFQGVAPFALNALSELDAGVGMLGLQQLERAGLVRRVISLYNEPTPEGVRPSRGAVGTVAFSVPAEPTRAPLEGASLVELQSDGDAEWLLRRLAADPDVEAVSRVPIRYLCTPAMALAVPPPAPSLWNLSRIDWPTARAVPGFNDAVGLKVAVLDTGIDPNHPDLAGRVSNYVHDYAHPISPVHLRSEDIVGHGTHVAGTISALASNGYGVDGVSAAQILAYKVFADEAATLVQGSSGPFYTYVTDPLAYRLALDDCLSQGVRIVNLSLGGTLPPEPVELDLYNALLQAGSVIVAAMGNDGEVGSPTSYPAAVPGVIAVGASRQDDGIASFSSRGSHTSLCAPGVAIWSTLPTYAGNSGLRAVPGFGGDFRPGAPIPRETDYDAWSGTSMAAPHVSGAVALLLAKAGALTPAEVKAKLEATTNTVAGMGGASFHPAFGRGRLNLHRLLA